MSGESTAEATVIWNPGAGSARQADDIRAALDSRPGVAVVETGSRDEAIACVEQACRDRARRVIAAGGDGTVNAVVTTLAQWRDEHGDAPVLAVLPLGTGNDLARSLCMPLDPAEAVKICLEGTARPMDVMEMTSAAGTVHIAGNMITAGNTGKYLEVLTDDLKQKWGALCYLRGAVDILEELEVFRVRLTVDQEPPFEVDALNLFFANGKTSGGGMTVCADAALNDGRFDLLVIQDGTGLDLAGLTVDYLTSDVRDSDLVLHRQCARVQIECGSLIPLSADGDAIKAEKFTVSVRSGAIEAVRGS